jgi:hypothetical protein
VMTKSNAPLRYVRELCRLVMLSRTPVRGGASRPTGLLRGPRSHPGVLFARASMKTITGAVVFVNPHEKVSHL